MTPPDSTSAPQSPVERMVKYVAASRFLTVSALLHAVIILLFGGTVLFNKYVEPPDFSAEGSDFLGASTEVTPPAPETPPMPTTPTETIPTPTVSAPVPSLAAITTTAPTTSGISIPVSMTPTLSKNISEMAPVPTTVKAA